MPYIPHTPDDVQAMLERIGVDSIDALFDEIPPDLVVSALPGVPEALSEMEVSRLAAERATADGRPVNFIGAGAYEHHIPAPVWALVTRGEIYSAYTPYQAEASQGTLQIMYEYQSMIAGLTGLDVSNASLYDGASALAEACLADLARGKHREVESLRSFPTPATDGAHARESVMRLLDLHEEKLLEVPRCGNGKSRATHAQLRGLLARGDLLRRSGGHRARTIA